jgi:hypothetical protein
MKKMLLALSLLALPGAQASVSYGSLNNFDVVNDTPDRCYGFQIELDDIHSTNITYTYDYNHYGVPKIIEDNTDAAHPKVFVRYEPKRNPDGSFASFTNPQDPAHPLLPTNGHAFTNPSVNLGGEHFGVGNTGNASVVKYNWLIDDLTNPGTLVLGPAVNVATPQFVYVPAVAGAPAQANVVIAPPEPEKPEINNIAQFGKPVWVKILKTVQPSGRKFNLDELVPDDETVANDKHWTGDLAAETEVEWQVFQSRPLNAGGGGGGGGGGGAANVGAKGELLGGDDLPNGDETVTRRYEFYVYKGDVNPEDGEALCSDLVKCPDSLGNFIGAQMAGFNVVTPLGLIGKLQDCEAATPYVDRTLVVGGNTPYAVRITEGVLPRGLNVDPITGVLSGKAVVFGAYTFTVQATDADAVTVTNAFDLLIAKSTAPPKLQIAQPANDLVALTWDAVIGQSYQVQFTTELNDATLWVNSGEGLVATDTPMTFSVAAPAETQRFYQVLLLP